MIHLKIVALLIIGFSTCTSLFAQNETATTILTSLPEDELTKIVVSSDFDLLLENRLKAHRQDAIVKIEGEDGSLRFWNTKIEARGKSRRLKCTDMPPIRLIFNRKEMRAASLSDIHKKYKLVTYCLEKEANNQSVLKEYWAYKMYNQLTNNSFRVRLLEVTYENTADNSSIVRYGFLIENDDELANRLNGEEETHWGFTRDSIQANNYQDVILFQYMIGNTDWEMSVLRNLVTVTTEAQPTLPVMIPYDFDASGIVDASYALPNPNVNQTSVRQRIVMGNFDDEVLLQSTREKFLKLYENGWCFEICPYLSEDSKAEMKDYLKDFEKLMDKEKKLAKLFLE